MCRSLVRDIKSYKFITLLIDRQLINLRHKILNSLESPELTSTQIHHAADPSFRLSARSVSSPGSQNAELVESVAGEVE